MPPTHQEIGGSIEKSEQVEIPSYEPYEQEKLASSISIKSEPKKVAVSGSCDSWIRQAGVSDVANAKILIMKESGCNPNAVNASSGACGLQQELPCGKSGCGLGNPVCQIKWMQNYCNQRYGSWAGAVAHSNSVGWY